MMSKKQNNLFNLQAYVSQVFVTNNSRIPARLQVPSNFEKVVNLFLIEHQVAPTFRLRKQDEITHDEWVKIFFQAGIIQEKSKKQLKVYLSREATQSGLKALPSNRIQNKERQLAFSKYMRSLAPLVARKVSSYTKFSDWEKGYIRTGQIPDDLALAVKIFTQLNQLTPATKLSLKHFSVMVTNDSHELPDKKGSFVKKLLVDWYQAMIDDDLTTMTSQEIDEAAFSFNNLIEPNTDTQFNNFIVNQQLQKFSIFSRYNLQHAMIATPNNQAIWIIENKAYAEELMYQYPEKSIITASGSLPHLVGQMINRLAKLHVKVYYSGDLDVNGINLAMIAKQQVPTLEFLGMSAAAFEAAPIYLAQNSDVKLKYDLATETSLKGLYEQIIKTKQIVEQETLSEIYELQLNTNHNKTRKEEQNGRTV
ncbi:DUF2399 domain-containing protein [Periweissella cryptocerci]|uniref:DUF2399 domain-containing protein n=1 Tax=Periweissella cryptocerci TaxID=2506420 RepID=A0A4V1AIH5_9LACO|nr:DUF2399 domain-containing protein [Periweissella cryptocerci]QBO35525.1 DUF2399 domain-containing protein [Periweissella cryptocerci]